MKLDVIYTEDSLKGIPGKLPDSSIDLIATDPPYGIAFMGRSWDKFNEIVRPQGAYEKKKGFKKLPRQSSAFIIEYFTPIWRECLRVLKPGAFAFVMSIPRQDCLARMIMSLEDAGFNVSFSPIFHAFSSGFPKAGNIAKMVDKRLGAERKIIGRKVRGDVQKGKQSGTTFAVADANKNNKDIFGYGIEDITLPATPQAQALDGSYSYNPKPAVEVVLVCQKPMKHKTYADQALDWYQQNEEVEQGKRERTDIAPGCVNFDDCRIPYQNEKPNVGGRLKNRMGDGYGFKERESVELRNGRFPANLLCGSGIDINLEALIEAKNKL